MISKELLILDRLALNPDASQRELSVATGISLGHINSILKKLCNDGFIRQESLSKKRVKYPLTQRGIAERARLSNEKILLTLRDYKKIRSSIFGILNRLVQNGVSEFVLEGDRGDIYEVITDVYDNHFRDRASMVWGPVDAKGESVILNLDRRFNSLSNVVNVLHELSL